MARTNGIARAAALGITVLVRTTAYSGTILAILLAYGRERRTT